MTAISLHSSLWGPLYSRGIQKWLFQESTTQNTKDFAILLSASESETTWAFPSHWDQQQSVFFLVIHLFWLGRGLQGYGSKRIKAMISGHATLPNISRVWYYRKLFLRIYIYKRIYERQILEHCSQNIHECIKLFPSKIFQWSFFYIPTSVHLP